MSDTTWQAVEDAVAAHLADESDGALLTSWVLAATGVSAADEDRTSRYLHANSDGPWHPLLGLMHMQRVTWEQRLLEDRED